MGKDWHEGFMVKWKPSQGRNKVKLLDIEPVEGNFKDVDTIDIMTPNGKWRVSGVIQQFLLKEEREGRPVIGKILEFDRIGEGQKTRYKNLKIKSETL